MSALDALDPDLEYWDAVHRILTVERGWTADQFERWVIRSLGLILRSEPPRTM